MKKQELENPADRYPTPPCKKQSQQWPGLVSQMDPRPDHGETSYRESDRLAGCKALITGGSNNPRSSRLRNPGQLRRDERYRQTSPLKGVKIGRR
jgi:hypothetical protein